jgi:hypothetical protein
VAPGERQPAAGIACERSGGPRQGSPSRPIGFALAAVERTVKAERCSCKVATKQQRRRRNRHRRRCAVARRGTRGCTDSPRECENLPYTTYATLADLQARQPGRRLERGCGSPSGRLAAPSHGQDDCPEGRSGGSSRKRTTRGATSSDWCTIQPASTACALAMVAP